MLLWLWGSGTAGYEELQRSVARAKSADVSEERIAIVKAKNKLATCFPVCIFLGSFDLEMEKISFSETLVDFQLTTRCSNPENIIL
jgi:hypothetical protein